MLTEGEIPYEELSVDELKQLALGEDWFIATSALGELVERDRTTAATVAARILGNSVGDVYLQAAALETAFQIDRDEAVAWMSEQVATCDGYLLDAIATLFLENQTTFQAGLALAVANQLCQRIETLQTETPEIAPDIRERVLSSYHHLQSIQTA